jgi:hypothetical protein
LRGWYAKLGFGAKASRKSKDADSVKGRLKGNPHAGLVPGGAGL